MQREHERSGATLSTLRYSAVIRISSRLTLRQRRGWASRWVLGVVVGGAACPPGVTKQNSAADEGTPWGSLSVHLHKDIPESAHLKTTLLPLKAK